MDTTDYHCWCAVFMLPYSLNCMRTRRTRREGWGEEDGEWVYLYMSCDVATGTVVCCTALFLLRVKVGGPLPLSHQQSDHNR